MRNIVLLFFFLVMNSCVEQKKDIPIGRYQESLESCRETVFIGNISSKKNFLSLMRCLRWRQELPTLYSVIQSVDEKDWNFLTAPIDEEFFYKGAAKKREKLFSFLYQSNANGQLKRIDNYLKRMSIKNITILLKLFLGCESDCSNRLYSDMIPQGASVVEFITSLVSFYQNANQEGVIDRLYHSRNKIFSDKSILYFLDNTTSNLAMVIKHPFYDKFLSDSLIAATSKQPSEVSQFIRRFSDDQSYKDWFDHFMSNGVSLLRFSHLAGLNEGRLVCEDQFSIDLTRKVDSLISNLSTSKYSLFVGYLLNDFSLLAFGEQICKKLDFKIREFNYMEFVKDGYRVKKYINDRPVKMLASDVGKIAKDPNFFNFLQSLIINGNYTSDLVPALLDFSKNPLLINILSYLNYLKESNKPVYDDIVITPYYLNDSMILQINKVLTFFNNNPDLKKHLSFVLSTIGPTEINAFVEESLKLFDAFDDPKKLLEFLGDVTTLSESLIDRYKAVIIKDEKSVTKLNNLYDKLIAASEINNFEKEFSLVLSSRYIIKAARLIGRGVINSNPDVESLFASMKIAKIKEIKSNAKVPKIQVKPGAGYECLDLISASNNFVEVISNINKKCAEVFVENNLFGLLQDLSTGFSSYNSHRYSFNSTSRDSASSPMFFNDGMLGEDVLKSGVVTLKKFFQADDIASSNQFLSIIGYLKKLLRNQKGYFGDFLIKAVAIADLGIEKKSNAFLRNIQLSSTLETLPESGFIFRENIKVFLLKLKAFLLKPDQVDFIERDKYSCEKFFTNPVGHNRCQDVGEIKKRIKNILYFLTRENERNRPTALKLLTEALSPDIKYEINFNNEVLRYQLSLNETANFIVNVNDLEFSVGGELVNQRKIKFHFVDDNGKKFNETFNLTTGDRLEAVVREVRFDGNYLGVHYMNSVAASPMYVETIQKKYGLLKACGVYLRYCLRTFTKEEYAMLRNGVNTYPSLWETETLFGNGKFIKTLLQVLVDSSSRKAAKSATVKVGKFEMPYMQSDSELKEHNGRILTEITYLASFSNLYRVLLRSFGSNENIRNYLNTEKFKYISKNIFSKTPPIFFEDLIKRIIKSLSDDQYKLLNRIIDQVSNLNDKEVVKLESIAHDLFFILSYMPEKSLEPQLKYTLTILEDLISRPQITSILLSEKNFGKIINVISPILRFLTDELSSQNSAVIESLFVQLLALVEKYDFNLQSNEGISLIDFIELFLSKEINVSDVESLISSGSDLFENKAIISSILVEGIDSLVQFLDKTHHHFDSFYNLFLSNIYYSTIQVNCSEDKCENNEQYDEVFKLVSFLASSEETDNLNISYLIDYLSNEKLIYASHEFSKLIEDLEILE